MGRPQSELYTFFVSPQLRAHREYVGRGVVANAVTPSSPLTNVADVALADVGEVQYTGDRFRAIRCSRSTGACRRRCRLLAPGLSAFAAICARSRSASGAERRRRSMATRRTTSWSRTYPRRSPRTSSEPRARRGHRFSIAGRRSSTSQYIVARVGGRIFRDLPRVHVARIPDPCDPAVRDDTYMIYPSAASSCSRLRHSLWPPPTVADRAAISALAQESALPDLRIVPARFLRPALTDVAAG